MDWRSPTSRDIAAGLLLLVMLTGLGLAWVFVPNLSTGLNAGFGPDWACTPQSMGGPTCVKRLPKAD